MPANDEDTSARRLLRLVSQLQPHSLQNTTGETNTVAIDQAAIIGIVFATLSICFMVFLYLLLHIWQTLAMVGSLTLSIYCFIQMRWMARRKKYVVEYWLLGGIFIAFGSTALFFDQVQFYSILHGLALMLLVNWPLRSRRRLLWWAAGGMLIALALVVERFEPFPRYTITQLPLLRIYVSGVMFGLALVVLWRFSYSYQHLSTIRAKLLLTHIGIALLPAVAIGAGSVVLGYRTGYQQVIGQLDAVVTLKEAEIATWVSSLKTDLITVSTGEEVERRTIALLQMPSPSMYLGYWLRNYFRQAIAQAGRYDEFFLMDRDGTVILSTDETQEGLTYFGQPFHQEGLQHPYLQPPIMFSSGQLSVIAAQPVQDDQGNVWGVLAGRASTRALNNITHEKAGLGETGETYLIGPDYTLIAEAHSGVAGMVVNTQATSAAFDQQTSGAGLYVGYRGVPVVGVYHWLPELQAVLLAEQDQLEAFESLYTSLDINLGVGLVAILLAVFVSLLLTRNIVAPLSDLAQTATQIASGNLTHSARVERNDEIGLLAKAFNSMTYQLRDLIECLEQRVAERTSELEALRETSVALSAQLESDELLMNVVDKGRQLLKVATGSLYLVDETTDTLRLVIAVGFSKDYTGSRLQPGEGLSGKVYQSGELLRINDYCQWEGRSPAWEVERLTAVLGVPLKSNGQVTGVLVFGEIDQPKHFDDHEVWLASLFANQAAIAIKNARLYQQAQQELHERVQVEIALRESEERYALAVRGANDGLWDWNLDTNTIYYSPRWKAMLGYEENEIGSSSKEWFRRIHPSEIKQVRLNINRHLKGSTQHFEIEHRMRHKNGSYRWMLSRGLAVRNPKGKVYRMAGSQTDITARKQAEEQLLHDAFHDALTGLPNRALLLDRLERAIERTKRNKDCLFAVLFLDIDRFKVINDSLGHVAGDQLLVAVARRLEVCLRAMDTITRIGGDEFVIILEDIKDICNVTRIADRLQGELQLPFHLNEQQIVISASIGIVISMTGYDCPEDMLRDADIALYRAKSHGKARYEIFDMDMRDRAMARLELETDLRQAIDNQEFSVYYQPIVILKTRKLIGFEALLRWKHPKRGMIPPIEFIPVAEETGLIISLGEWVLRSACRQLCAWQEQFSADDLLTVSVNLSGKQFTQPNFFEQVKRVLQETGLNPQCLKLEITESILMEDTQYAIAVLFKLRDLGVQTQIDDFGTGYSSLSYLRRFPIDAIKVDRSFISQMDTNENDSEIVRTIVSLANELGMDTIAEGVENAEQLTRLESFRCQYGQGFYISRPLDQEAISALLDSEIANQLRSL